ncbi:ABC transporter ATP-binding protein [Facklamia languida]
MSYIQVDNLVFSYKGSDEIILKDINFTAEKGEIITILGPSGCGKSTLLKLLAGLQIPSQGRIQMNGEDIKSASLDRAFVFQNYGLFPWMKAGENIELALKQKFPKLSKDEVKKRMFHLLSQVGLGEEVAHKLPKELSGGMQQRCSIARALGIDSPVLLMDEPFGALDAITRAKLQDLLLDLMEEFEQEKTVFFVTHDVDEAILLGTRTIVLGQKPSSILYDVKVPLLKGEDRATLYEDPAILELRNQLLYYINLDISKRVDEEDH